MPSQTIIAFNRGMYTLLLLMTKQDVLEEHFPCNLLGLKVLCSTLNIDFLTSSI